MSARIVVLTGMSGSGKGVALNTLEDAGYYCVDNLPPELLPQLLSLEQQRPADQQRLLAVSVDARSATSLHQVLPLLDQLRADGQAVRPIFLDASDDTLVRRFSETRRPHPLMRHKGAQAVTEAAEDADHQALLETIRQERELVEPLRERSAVIDTSLLRPAQLRTWVRHLVQAQPSRLTVVFQSFAFKHGVPLDADFVFDVRMLPNPYYIKELRPQTGKDAPVADYLRQQPESGELIAQIEAFLSRWLPSLENDQRSYVTVAIGCTGGQHRSVYCVEQLKERFKGRAVVLTRHREQDGK
ncbi:RNase adapter RapZ [Aquabacterium lacunae]|uniref:RNase adapter RapZ n=1 Tax=Aquabacterium lacunae TaxID=2528630 RepID=A0A4Q9H501_9BURK|nr:RNase adapter RapZ [Aquabacterium lacunae]TBO32734.1 RNase adapter RapZ [Aquabacterium lacunae]